MNNNKPYVLSIAGFDPSAGAGVLADIKTFENNGVYGFGVVTALTWQNDKEFDKVEWLDYDRITSQIEVLIRRFSIKYIKIGLIENLELLVNLVAYLHRHLEHPIIIFDPILKASAGFDFHKGETMAFIDAIKRIYCITPNIPEAEWIFGSEQLNEKLEDLSEQFNIYLKGGHSNENDVIDLLYTSDHTYAFAHERLKNGAKHGSGCVLSAALTAQLALGNTLPIAAEHANNYTYNFLASNESLLGFHNISAYE